MRTAAVLLAGFVVATAPATPPRPLVKADLVVDSLAWDSDTAAARRVLGAPTSVRTFDLHADDEILHLTDWSYAGLTITFYESGHQYMMKVTGSARTTGRGLRVGMPASRAFALYGPPRDRTPDQLYYTITDEPRSRLGMIIFLRSGTIFGIRVGVISEGD